MLIGLISDTHVRVRGYHAGLGLLSASELLPEVKEVFRDVDLILHAGDIYTLPILDELETVAPILASEGDDDPFEIMNDKRVKWRQVITVEGVTIWLAHDQEVLSYWHNDGAQPDIIVIGHTHKSSLKNNGNTLIINPGSAHFPDYKFEPGTVGLLTINSGKAQAQIIQL